MSDELPQGWAIARVADVTERVANIKPEDSPDKEFGYVDISSIDNSSFVITDLKRFKGKAAPSRARRPIRPNDIVFSNVRTYLRNIALVGSDCSAEVCSTGLTVLRPNGAVEPRFLFPLRKRPQWPEPDQNRGDGPLHVCFRSVGGG